MSTREITLKFIKHEEGSEELLEKAFNAAKARDINVESIQGAELLEQDLTGDKSLFVTDVFKGTCFDLLVSQKKRVYGPLCILQCLERTIPVPNFRQPIYSLAMYKVIVCCTSVSREVRDKLYDLVEKMGGTSAKDFRSAVTHLVAGEVGSKKYTIACNLKKVVVLPSWVEQAWERTQNCDFDAMDTGFVSSCLCPILKGCTICVTGIDAKKRKEIQNIVHQHGGVYMAELKLKVTTHLLVEHPTGDKYEFAIRWNVHCVHPDWLSDCVKTGYWLEESSYLVKAERDLDKARSMGGRLSVTTINATLNSTNVASKKAAAAAQQSVERHGHKDIFHETRLPSSSEALTMKPSHSDNDFDYNLVIPCGEMFLDGCKIYLTGFTGARLETLQRIINGGGGTRFNQINGSVTHVVMGEKLKKDVDILATLEFSPHIVTAQWLLDCCRQEKCVSEGDYCCMEISSDFDEMQKRVEEATKKNQQLAVAAKQQLDDGVDDVMNQYLELLKDDVIPDLPEQDKLATEQNEKREVETQMEVNADEHDDSSTNINDDTTTGLLHGTTMRIKGFIKEQQKDLKDVIESHGGIVLDEKSSKIASYAVLPMNYQCFECKAEVMVTFCWLEQSFERVQLLDPKSNFLFMPFSLPKGTFPLKQCVISISQYAGIERDHLMQLAEMLGAHYQEYFSRKAKDNFLVNTHLLLQEPTGSKYEAAERWEIPAVTAEWLFECACEGSKVSEKPFLVNNVHCVDNEELQGMRGDLEAVVPTNVPDITNNNVMVVKDGDKVLDAKDVMQPPHSIPKRQNPEVSKSEGKQAPACFGRPKRPSFDLTDAIEVLQSPCCSSGSSSNHSRLSRGSNRSSLLLDDYLQEHIQAALKNTGNIPGTRARHDDDDEQNMSKDDTSKDDVEEPESKFLHGVILHVSKKLSAQQNELYNITCDVGGDCRRSLDHSCTHIIHEGRLTKEYSQAKSKGVYVVSPYWLHSCIEEQCRVDETQYPTTYNPKLALSVAVKTRRSGRDVKPEIKVEEIPELQPPVNTQPEDTTSTVATIVDKPILEKNKEDLLEQKKPEIDHCEDSQQSDSLQTKEEIKQIKGLMQAMTTRRRSRRVTSGSSGGSRDPSGESGGDSNKKPVRKQSSRLRTLRSDESKTEDDGDDEPVQTITYDDPKSRIERERIIAQLTNCSSPNNIERGAAVAAEEDDDDETFDEIQVCKLASEYDTKDTEDPKLPTVVVKAEQLSPPRSQTPEAPPIALQVTSTLNKPAPVSLLETDVTQDTSKQRKSYKFLLSAMSQQEKIDYGALIEELGGELFDSQYFNPVCCHTIVGQLNRNEKCLASIAAGNWVLHKSFLESSRLAGYFVEEEAHEWGVEIPGEPLTALACSARRWRIELKEASEKHKMKYGAFQNWRVLLCVESNKVASFTRLLEAGGAKVIETTPPFKNITDVTHTFINRGKSSPVESVDFDLLQKAGILVLRTDYIANYLMENPAPSTEKYVFRKSQESVNKKRKATEDLGENIEKRQRR